MRLRVTCSLFALVLLCLGTGLVAKPGVVRATVTAPEYPNCPAATQQLATITGRLYRDREPRQIDHPIVVPGSATLTVLGFVEEGHPSECPGGRCNQGQLNEEFSVKLNGVEFARYLDKGPYDQWFEVGPWSTAVTTPGDQVLQLAHLMTGRHNQPGSVTYKLSVCAASTDAPTISVPDDIVVDAESANGTPVSYSASAVDGFGASLAVSCTPASGARFPIGISEVTCQASDSYGNSASAGFKVTVNAPTAAPTISVPDDIVVDAESASGTRVSYTASAVDVFGTALSVTCRPASDTLFPIGETQVGCRASDSFGNSASASFKVTVQAPTAAPVITVPNDIVVNAASASGARVSYTASAVDAFGTTLAVSCTPASGALFPIGVTEVTCRASDSYGNSASASFKVTVRAPSGPPTVNVPSNIVAEAESASGARVNYSVSAVDGFGQSLTVSCNKSSGTVFPLGVSTVTCSATDSFGASASASFTITVRDTTPPSLSLPQSFTVVALSEEGATVEYSADAVDLVDPMPLLECSPPSARVFAIGNTVVSCEASDSFGNSAIGTFTVSVVLDVVGPRIVQLSLNDGAAQTATRDITLRFSATDPEPGSGVAEYLVNEYIPDLALGIWTIVRSSSWQATNGETTRSWTLTADAGAHYVQVLVRDRAGNISPQPGGAVINYVPASDSIALGATRIYRYQVQAGQSVDVTVTALSGDPDLFVYPPSYPARPAWESANRGGDERVRFVAPESGSYQIEVYAHTAATYRIEVLIAGAVPATSNGHSEAAATQSRREPAFPLDAWPGMPSDEQLRYRVYLPSIR